MVRNQCFQFKVEQFFLRLSPILFPGTRIITQSFTRLFPSSTSIFVAQSLFSTGIFASLLPVKDVHSRNKATEDEELSAKLLEIVESEEKVEEIIESMRTSMGMDISELDLINIER